MTSDGERPITERSLCRTTSDRFLGGVAGGLARRLDVDPAIVRIGLVCLATYLAFSWGSPAHLLVLLPYAVAWATVPADGQRSLLLQLPARAAVQELGLIAVLLVVAVLAAGRPETLVVAALGGLAAILLRDRPDREVHDGADAGPAGPHDHLPPPPAGFEGTAARPAAAPTVVDGATGTGRSLVPAPEAGVARPWSAPAASTASPRPARPPRPRRAKREPALWPLALGLLLALAIGAAAIDGVLGVALDPRIVVDLALLVTGGVLTLSAWRGRARLALLPVPLLLLAWLATSVPDIGRFDGAGRRDERPTSLPVRLIGQQPTNVASYELGYGDLDVDLTALDLADGSHTRLGVAVTAGRARIRVPADARLRLRGTVGLGAVGVEVSVPGSWGEDRSPAANRTFDETHEPVRSTCRERPVPVSQLFDIARYADIQIPRSRTAPATATASTTVPDPTTTVPTPTSRPGGSTVTDPPPVPTSSPAPTTSTTVAGAPLPSSPLPTEALLDAIEAAGFPRPEVTGTFTDLDRVDPIDGEDEVTVLLDDAYELCTPTPADPDPPTITIDATLGLGDLEVIRV